MDEDENSQFEDIARGAFNPFEKMVGTEHAQLHMEQARLQNESAQVFIKRQVNLSVTWFAISWVAVLIAVMVLVCSPAIVIAVWRALL